MERKAKRKTIAFIPASMRPPHRTHWDMVKHYSQMADYVIVILSNPENRDSIRMTSTGTEIEPEVSKKILEIYLSCFRVKNVKVVVSNTPSPIRQLMYYISRLTDCDVILGVGEKDATRYDSIVPSLKHEESVTILPVQNNIFRPRGTKTVSGTMVRNHIQDRDFVVRSLPDGLPERAVNIVADLIQKKDSEDRKMMNEKEYIEYMAHIVKESYLGDSEEEIQAPNGEVQTPAEEESKPEEPKIRRLMEDDDDTSFFDRWLSKESQGLEDDEDAQEFFKSCVLQITHPGKYDLSFKKNSKGGGFEIDRLIDDESYFTKFLHSSDIWYYYAKMDFAEEDIAPCAIAFLNDMTPEDIDHGDTNFDSMAMLIQGVFEAIANRDAKRFDRIVQANGIDCLTDGTVVFPPATLGTDFTVKFIPQED